MEWCKWFKDIEADPSAKVKPITIRELYEAQEHLAGCDVCYNRSERVMAKYNAKKANQIGFNLN